MSNIKKIYETLERYDRNEYISFQEELELFSFMIATNYQYSRLKYYMRAMKLMNYGIIDNRGNILI